MHDAADDAAVVRPLDAPYIRRQMRFGNGLAAADLASAASAIGTMRRDHLNAVVSQLLIQRIAVIGAIADQILRLGFDHVEVEA